jgi:cyclopropane-fatty-acyl-phospholipid synthase
MSRFVHACLQTFLQNWLRRGRLDVRLPDGATFSCGDGEGPSAAVALTEPSAPLRLLRDPTLALGELYMDGGLVVERGGVYDVLEMGLRNLEPGAAHGWIRAQDAWRYGLRRLHQANDARRARRNVAHHYDLGNALYELFLDSDMQYSCAYFERPGQSLEEAQLAKKRRIAAKLHVAPGQSVLDIGCGWGGMALYLARACGARPIGVTLSQEQLERARARAAQTKAAAQFRLQDYRAVTESFDRIVSVGMLEHVGAPYLDAFFAQVARLLKKDGVALVHTIGRPEGPGITNPWIKKHIFPGGYIPALSELARAIERSGLMIADVEVLRLHYAETLKAWRERFLARRAEAAAMYDERFCRMWEFYLAGSEACFRLGQQVVFQIQLVRDVAALPDTRDYVAEGERRLRACEEARDLRLAGE